MGRYQGVSPFQDKGFVWDGTGQILTPNGARLLFDKPSFTFGFDFLYCEQTNCHRTYNGAEEALAPNEIDEVMAYINAQIALPLIVDGVNADGKYLANVPETDVVRIVDNPPPSKGTWRFDFAKAAIYPGDHWVQAICVDADGRWIGNVDEGEWAMLAASEPPGSPLGEDWRWQAGAWADVRPLEARLSAAQERAKALAWAACVMKLETASATAIVGGVAYQYGCDAETRENIIGLNAAISVGVPIPSPRPYWPKGYTGSEGVQHTHADFAAIGGALLVRKDQFVQAYLQHKIAIMALTTPEGVLAYDLSTGWPD